MGGSSRVAWIIACSLWLALLVGVPPSALAGFAPAAEQLSEGAAEISSTTEAVDSAGNTTAVWQQNAGHSEMTEQVAGRRIAADGSLGPLLALSMPGQPNYEPAVGVGPGGGAFTAWRAGSPSSVSGRWINPDGSLGPILAIVTGSGSEDAVGIHVVVSATGIATVAWFNNDAGNRIELRRIEPDGTQSAQVNTTLDTTYSIGAAALPGGATFLFAGADTDVVAANGTAAATVDASTSGFVSSLVTGSAFDAQGEGLLAWRRGNAAPFAVIARRIDSAGAPIGSEIVVEPETPDFISAAETAAVDSNGNFLVGWSRQDEGNEGHAYARAVSSDGSLPEIAHAVSAVAEPVPEPLLALDDRGLGVAAFDFLGSGAASDVVEGQVLGSNAAPLGELTQLSGGNAGVGASLASEPASGVASIVWAGPSGAKEVAMVSRYMEPPTCADSEATVVLGLPVTALLSCSGIGINNVRVLSPPAHGTLAAFEESGPSLLYTPTPGYQGTDSFVYEIENDGGASAETTVRIAVNRAPILLVAPTPLLLSGVSQSHGTWRAGKALASIARKHKLPPIGTTFSFTLNEQAKVSFAFTQQVGGRRVRGKCVAQNKNNRHKASCKRAVTRGTLSFTAQPGRDKVSFQGRISASKELAPGRYTLVITATASAGERSQPKSLSFTIV